MKQFYLKTLVLLLFMMVGQAVSAYCYVDGIFYNLDENNNTAEVTSRGNVSYTGSVTIPESFTFRGSSYSVTSIGNEAFLECRNVTSITIPNSVTSIGSQAFFGCSGLTSIAIPNNVTSIGNQAFEGFAIPNNVTSIGNQAFEGCSGLTSITIPNSITTIAERAFAGCSGLTSVTIPNSVDRINSQAFYGCNGLTNITIPNSVTTIISGAFDDCQSLYKVFIESDALISKNYFNSGLKSLFGNQVTEYVIGNDVTSIGDFAFYDCSGLTSITIPNSVTSIGNLAFSGCTGLTSITIPNSVTTIIRCAFLGCSSLTSITLPNSVTSIEHRVFSGCTGLTSITIPNSITTIAERAFEDCSGLRSITIGNSVTSISYDAFYGCSNLTEVIINSNVISNFSEIFGAQVSKYVLGDNITSIGYRAFSGSTNLTTITIPCSVTSIGYHAFYGCTGLKKVIVPDIKSWCSISFPNTDSNPLHYAHHLFSDENTEVTNLVIPDGVTSINKYLFDGCSGLTSISIPSSVTSIGDNAFDGCTGLKSIALGKNVASIGKNAFTGCENLAKVIVPDIATWCDVDFAVDNSYNSSPSNPLSIAHHLYSDENTEVIDLVIPEGVSNIKRGAFYGASSLKSVTIPGSLKSIGYNAFYGCTGLTKTIIPDLSVWCDISFGDNPLKYSAHLYSDEYTEITNLKIPFGTKNISSNAFSGAKYVGTVNIPNTVQAIGSSAFSGCSSLKSLVLPNGLQRIGGEAFKDCSSLETVLIPNSVQIIEGRAFAECLSLYSVTSLINMPFKLSTSAFEYTGGKYEKDVVYMAATLYVPRGKMAMYRMTQGWEKFLNVTETDTKFKLKYYVDGQEYKTYEIQATEVVTPEPDPYKEGYIFSGWSTIPYLMPAQDVVVTGSFTIDPDYKDGIDAASKEENVKPEVWYGIGGQRHEVKHHGLNIVRMTDGSVRKVMVK